MQGYYNTPAVPGMNPAMQLQMAQQQMNPMMPMPMQPGMGMGMQPGMGMGMQPGMNMNMGMGGVGIPMGMGYGQAYRQLGYDYNLPALSYKPDTSWGAWDLANAQYGGSSMDRGFFDNIISTLATFFANRHLSEDAAREAHRRVYYSDQGADAGNKTLGGAAAYQAYLIWDRDHYSAYHHYPSTENRERFVGLAVAELFRLWDSVQPRSSRANNEEAAQYAAATAKYLFDRHYDLNHSHAHNPARRSGYWADDDSDAGSDGRRMRRRSFYNGQPGYDRMNPGMPMSMQMPMPGQGMQGMMMQPGMNAMMPMQMQAMQPMGMGGYPGMGMGGYPGMGMGQGQMPMQNGLAMGMIPMGAGGMGIGESQAAPGMHPYHYGSASGVGWGSTPIDQMGNPTFPGGPGRTQYGYGQPRYY